MKREFGIAQTGDEIYIPCLAFFVKDMCRFCGTTITVSYFIYDNVFRIEEDNGRYMWSTDIGDIVQIRQWDDMVKEFGVNYYGVIRCNNYCSFVGEMKKYCGKKLRIDTIKNLGNTYYYTMTAIPWTFTSEMFEKGDLSMLITRRQECIK